MQDTYKVSFPGLIISMLLAMSVTSCNLFKEKVNEVRIFSSDMESRSFPSFWKGTESIIEGNGHSGIHFSRMNNQHPFGFGYESEFPGFVKSKNFALGIGFYYRLQNAKSKAILWISVNMGDSLIFKQSFSIASDSAINRWALFTRSINFPANIPPNATMSVSLQNSSRNFVDIDDYKISFLRIGRPSFLITDKKKEERSFLSGFTYRPVYKNKFYTILYSDKLGDFQIRSANNDKILSSAKYYIQWIKNNDTLSHFANKLVYTPGEKNSVRFSGETSICNFTINLVLNDESSLIKAESKTTFKDSIQLVRETMIFSFSQGINEVYRKNTLIDSKRFRNEYWLDKEGIKIGSGAKTLYLYHNPDISSVQLSVRAGELFINLDYYRDHPLAEVLAGKGIVDMSCNLYKAGASRENDFQLFAGSDFVSLPRFMKSPNGYLSTFVLTKKTDCISLQTKLDNGIGSGSQFVESPFINYFDRDSGYYFYGHLIYPYPGFGDFFPTPNYWSNMVIAPDIYSWRPDPFIKHVNKWDSIFSPKRLKDFIANRGIVFCKCEADIDLEKIDSLLKSKEFEKVQTSLPFYKTKRLINFTTVKEIMEYWLALEKVRIRLLADGNFRLYNSSYQDVKGLALAIRADNILINNKAPENYYRDQNGDIIVWFTLPALKSAVIRVTK